jgi:hypothetical protein
MTPRVASGYRPEDVELVRSLYLTVARVLGVYTADLTVIGGYVPHLLIPQTDLLLAKKHVGTVDLDLVLELAILDDERYKEIAALLRASGFEPDVKKETGARILQRWIAPGTDGKGSIEFLMPPAPEDEGKFKPGQIKKLEGDFGAIVLRAGKLAFRDRVEIEVSGTNLQGAKDTRTMGICGPAAFVVLKAFAHHLRDKPKDAYDLDYLLELYPGSPDSIVERFDLLADAEHVPDAIAILRGAFATLDHTGPVDVGVAGLSMSKLQFDPLLRG